VFPFEELTRVTVIARPGRKLDCPTLSVLIVDDQPFFRVLLSEILRSMGVREIHTATDGVDALDALENVLPDVVITDWVMPEMDGLELTRQIRKSSDPQIQLLPIVLVTANNLKSQIEKARNCGVDTFVLKPVSVKSVIERLREVIERPRPLVLTEAYSGPCRRRRSDPAFRGPFRRVDDPMEIDTPEDVTEALDSMISLATQRIAALARGLKAGNTQNLQPIRLATDEVRGLAGEIGDSEIRRVAEGLARYIDTLSSPGLARADVILTHLEAIEVLMKTPRSESVLRGKVVQGLEQVVAKTLKAA
jgi:CheY-like chemotaxis protein